MIRSRADWRTVGRGATVLIALIVVLVAAWRSGLFAIHDRARLATFVADLRGRPLLVPSFLMIYAIAAAAGVPVTPLTLAGGVLFGAARGIVLNLIAETAAAALAFVAIRFATPARQRSRMSPRTLFRLRLVPVMPFALLNAGAALSEMSWPHYMLATAAGIIPVTVVYTVSAAALVAGVAGSGPRAFLWALGSAAVLIIISFVLRPVRRVDGTPS
jgi:uncharacterized membrane protein YdjX (TVP38/TMEM64 family)